MIGLMPAFVGGAVELEAPPSVPWSVSATAGMPSSLAARDELLDTAGAVEQRVLAVHVEMDEIGGHGWAGF